MDLSVEDIKLIIGGLYLDVIIRDKAIKQLTDENTRLLESPKIREFPKEADNGMGSTLP